MVVHCVSVRGYYYSLCYFCEVYYLRTENAGVLVLPMAQGGCDALDAGMSSCS